ncbi:alpha/beta hydrolase [Algirhabdus cladophorae]|uniref:alpha/beta hydrolase n=1 Tax=Algirhabdus cladophorae TaxID=3377108 RepID=UPI003B84A82F
MLDPKTLDADLAAAEAAVPNLKQGAEKQIIWAGKAGDVTDLAIVYVHGFSATKHEIRPVPDTVAKTLGANLYYARLAGHGCDGAAMGEPAWTDWLADTMQALDIGRAIGRQVIVVSCSTGCPLVTLALGKPDMTQQIVGNVLVSPNFGMASKLLNLVLGLPLARRWLPALAGRERGFEPISEAHAKWWTTRYPSTAVFTMMDTVHAAWRQDCSGLRIPTLVQACADDSVVSWSETQRFMKGWGGPVSTDLFVMGPGDDKNGHVIAGDIFSKGQTDAAVQSILDWWQKFHIAG